jgi:aldehyde:ferredoxin oxidoreductase
MQATPAYNTTKLLIGDMPTTIKAFEMCNVYGVDIHSWTCAMGWAIECFERGILSVEETDGLHLRWGDGPLALESIRRIALREGNLGDLLAEGVAVASAKLGRGSQAYAMQIMGMELDDELRVDKAEALGILAETRGAGHTLATPGGIVKLASGTRKGLPAREDAGDPHAYGGKPERVAEAARQKAILDCLGICFFSGPVQQHLEAYLFPEGGEGDRMAAYAELVKAASGWSASVEVLDGIAERMLAVEKSLNVLAGLGREDEMPPDRFYEPIPGGRSKGMALDRQKTREMLSRQGQQHGWDPDTGIPGRETLLGLGLTEVADRLADAGKL